MYALKSTSLFIESTNCSHT